MAKKKIDIFEKIEEMYNEEKPKKFILHLVSSYFPLGKAEKIIENPGKTIRCSLCYIKLVSINEMLEGVNSEAFKKNFMDHLSTLFKEGEHKAEHPMKKFIGKRKIGIRGQNTDSSLCPECYKELFSWLTKKLISGDKQLEQVNKKMVKRKPDKPKDKTKKPKSKFKPQLKTATFGDIKELQELKEKFNKKE